MACGAPDSVTGGPSMRMIHASFTGCGTAPPRFLGWPCRCRSPSHVLHVNGARQEGWVLAGVYPHVGCRCREKGLWWFPFVLAHRCPSSAPWVVSSWGQGCLLARFMRSRGSPCGCCHGVMSLDFHGCGTVNPLRVAGTGQRVSWWDERRRRPCGLVDAHHSGVAHHRAGFNHGAG